MLPRSALPDETHLQFVQAHLRSLTPTEEQILQCNRTPIPRIGPWTGGVVPS